MDASDIRTKRGGKLFRERQSAKGKAKAWLVFMLLTLILFISLTSAARDDCLVTQENNPCICIPKFKMFFTLYVVVVVIHTIFHFRHVCRVEQSDVTRREIKIYLRQSNFIFGLIFPFLLASLIVSYKEEFSREECLTDFTYNEMVQVASIIIFSACFLTVFRVIICLYIIATTCQRMRIRKLQPDYLSSDEEDDKE